MGTKCCKCSNGDANAKTGATSQSSGSSVYAPAKRAKGSRQLIGDRYHMGENNNTVHLTVEGVTREDEGEYTVTAKNIAGESRSAVQLRIKDNSFDEDDTPNFLRRLNDLAVKVGTRTRFLVEIRSSSDIKVTWHRNDLPITEGERFHFLHEGNFFCVDVAPVTVEDGGRWTCMAENRAGRSSCSCRLNVLVPKAYKAPEFLEELKAVLTEQGTVSLECKVVGVPTPVLKWYKDGKEIKAGDVFALTANPEDPTSLGTYTCEAINCMGKSYSSSRVHVVGKGSREGSLRPADYPPPTGPPPHFSQELKNEKVKIGSALTLSCQVTVPPWPRSITWYNKEGKIEPSEKFHIMEDGLGGYSIEIYPLEATDEGEWKCVATSETGVVGITQCMVSMSYPKNYRKPRFLESLKAVLTEEGLVSFECKVVGVPTPQLQWFKDGQELRPGDVYKLSGTNSLGSYSCIAKNCMGEAKSSAELTVEDIQSQLNEEEKLQLFSKNQPPRFIRGLKSIEAKINEDFRFTIQVTVSPEPNLSWFRDDEPISDTDRYHITRENLGTCHLDIRKAEVCDQAEWKCVASNSFGQSVTSGFLKLTIPKHFKKPRFLECLRAILSEEGAVNLECKVIGVPQPVLKWYKDGKELKPGDIHKIISGQDGTCCLGTYTCEAQNCMGAVSSSASLLGFEDRMAIKESAQYKTDVPYPLAKNTSLSTIHEERTSQMYDTPVTERSVTMDERGDVSFSFDGKEVSISLYETPDLTEDEALQVVEMYAEELSEHISEQNVVELPPLRFTKESSKSGPLLMEAVVIDITPEYFASAEEDLRTEADFEDVSMSDETTQNLASPEIDDEAFYEKINTDFLEKALASLTGTEPLPLQRSQERSSDSDKMKDKSDSYQSLSSPKKGSRKVSREEDVTMAEEFMSDSKVETFASARGSSGLRRQGSKEETGAKKKKSRSRSASIGQDKNQSFEEKIEEGVVTVTAKKKSVSRSSSGGSFDKDKAVAQKTKKKSVSRSDSGPLEQELVGTGAPKKKRISRSASGSVDKEELESVPKKKRVSRSASRGSMEDTTTEDITLTKKKRIARSASGSLDGTTAEGSAVPKKKRISRSASGSIDKESGDMPTSPTATEGSAVPKKKRISRSASGSIDKESGDMPTSPTATEGSAVPKKKRISRSASGSIDKESGDMPTSPTATEGAAVPKKKRISRSASGSIDKESAETSMTPKKKKTSLSPSGSLDRSNLEEPGVKRVTRKSLSQSSSIDKDGEPGKDVPKKRNISRSASGSIDKEDKELPDHLVRSASASVIRKKRSSASPSAAPDMEKSQSADLKADMGSESALTKKKKVRSRSGSIEQSKLKKEDSGEKMGSEGEVGARKRSIDRLKKKRSQDSDEGKASSESVKEGPDERRVKRSLSKDVKERKEKPSENKSEQHRPTASPAAFTAVTKSLQEIQKGLSNIEEQIVSQAQVHVESPRAKSNLAALDALTHPIQEIQKGLRLIEQQVKLEQSTERPLSPELSILDTIARPIQDFEIGLRLVEEPKTPVETNESLEVINLVVNHLQKQLSEAKEKAIKVSGSEEIVGVLEILTKPVEDLHVALNDVKALKESDETEKSNTEKAQLSVELLRTLAQPVQDLQSAIEVAEHQAKLEEEGEPSLERPCSMILVALSDPMKNLRSAISLIEQQAKMDIDDEESISEKILEKVSGPIEEINRGISLIEQHALMEDSHELESSISNTEIFESLSQPIQDLHRGLAQIVQEVLFSTPKIKSQIDKESIPVLHGLVQFTDDILENLTETSRVPQTLLKARRILSPLTEPLLELKDAMIHIEQFVVFESGREPVFEITRTALLESLDRPLQELNNQLLLVEADIEGITETGVNKNNLTQILQQAKKAIAVIKFESEMEISDKPMSSILNSLLTPLRELKLNLSSTDATEKGTHPLVRSSSTLGKSLELIKQGSEEEKLDLMAIEEPKISLAVLRPLEKPLQDLEEGFGSVIQHVLEQENLNEIERPAIERQLHTLLEILSQSFEMFQEKWLRIQAGREENTTLLEVNALLDLVLELKEGANSIEEQVVEFETISNKTSDMIKTNVYSNLKKLHASLIDVECWIRKESLEVIPELKALNSTIDQIQEKISIMQKDKPIESSTELKILETISQPLVELHENLEKVNFEHASAEKSILDEVVEKSLGLFKENLERIEETLRGKANLEELVSIPSVVESFKELKHDIEECTAKEISIENLAPITQTLEKFRTHVVEMQSEVATETVRELKLEEILPADTLTEVLYLIERNVATIEDKIVFPEEIKGTLSEPLTKLHAKLEEIKVSGDEMADQGSIVVLQNLIQPLNELQKGLETIESEQQETTKELAIASCFTALALPIQEMQKGIATVQQQTALRLDDDGMPEHTYPQVLETLLQPFQELQEGLTQVQEKIESHKLKPPTIETSAHNLKKLEKQLITIQTQESPLLEQVTKTVHDLQDKLSKAEIQGKITEEVFDSLEKLKSEITSQGDGLPSEAKKLLASIEVEVNNIEQQANVTLTLKKKKKEGEESISSLCKVVKELQAEIENKANIFEDRSSSLKILATPLQELEKALEAVDDEEMSTLSDITSILDSKTIAVPLQEFSLCLAKIEDQIVFETAILREGDKDRQSALEAIAHPIADIRKNLAALQHEAATEGSLDTLSEQTDASVIKALANELHELQKAVAVVQEQTVVDSKRDLQIVPSETKQATVTATSEQGAAVTTEVKIMEPQEEDLSDKTDISLLKTIARPMQELEKILIQIKEHLTFETEDQCASDKLQVSVLETLAEPARELQSAVAVIEHQVALEAREDSMTEKTSASKLETLAQPIYELHRGLAEIQQQVVLMGENRMEKSYDVEMIESIAEPIEELFREIAAIQEQTLIEPDVITASDKVDMSLLKTLATPTEEVRKILAVIEQCEVFEPDLESMSTQADPSMMTSLAKPIQQLHEGLSQIQQIVLETGDNLPLNEVECLNVLKAIAKPVSELERHIAVMQIHQYVEDESGEVKSSENFEMVKKLATPLHELANSLAVVEQQLLEPNLKSMSDNDTLVADLTNISSPKSVSPFEKLLIEEQFVLEDDGNSINQDSNLEDLRVNALIKSSTLTELATTVNAGIVLKDEVLSSLKDDYQITEAFVLEGQESARNTAVVEQPELLESGVASFVSTLSDRGDEEEGEEIELFWSTQKQKVESIGDADMELSWKTDDVASEKGHATVIEQRPLSTTGRFDKQAPDKETAALQKEPARFLIATSEKPEVFSTNERLILHDDITPKILTVGIESPFVLAHLQGQDAAEYEMAETLSEVDSITTQEDFLQELDVMTHMHDQLNDQQIAVCDVLYGPDEQPPTRKLQGESEEESETKTIQKKQSEDKVAYKMKEEVKPKESEKKEETKKIDEVKTKEAEKKREGQPQESEKKKKDKVKELEKKEAKTIEPEKKEEKQTTPEKKQDKAIEPEKKEAAKPKEPEKKEAAKSQEPEKKEVAKLKEPEKKEVAKPKEPEKNEAAKPKEPEKKEATAIESEKKEEKPTAPEKKETKAIEPDKKQEKPTAPEEKEAKAVEPEKKETKAIEAQKKEEKPTAPEKKESKAVEPQKKEAAKPIESEKKEAKAIDPERKEEKPTAPGKKEGKQVEPEEEKAKAIETEKKEEKPTAPEKKEAKAIEPEKQVEKPTAPEKKEAKATEPEKKEAAKPTEPEKKEAKAIEAQEKEEKPPAPEKKEAKAVEPEMKEAAKPIEPEKKEAKPVEPEKKEEKPTAPEKKEAKAIEPEKKEAKVIESEMKEAAKPIEPEKKEAKPVEPEKKEEKPTAPEKKEAKAVEPEKKEAKVIEPEKKQEKPTAPEKKEAKAVEPEKKEAAKPIEPEKKEAKPVEPEKKEEKPTAPEKKEAKAIEPEKQVEKPTAPEKKEEKPTTPEKKEAKAVEPEKKEAKVIKTEKKEEKPTAPEKKEANAIEPEKHVDKPTAPEKKEEKPTTSEKKEAKAVEPEKKEAKAVEPEKKEAKAIETEKKEAEVIEPEKKEAAKLIEPEKKEAKAIDPEKKEETPTTPEKKEAKAVEPEKKEAAKPIEPEKKEGKAIEPQKKEEKPTAPEKKEAKAVEPEKKEAAKPIEPEKMEATLIEPEKKEEKPTAPEKKEAKAIEPVKKEAAKPIEPEMKEAKAIEPEKKEEKEAKAVEPQKKEAKVIEPEKKEEKPTTPEKKEAKAIEPEKKEEKPTAPEKKEAKAVEPEKKKAAKPIEPEKMEAKLIEPEKKEEKPTAPEKKEAKAIEPVKKEAAKPIEPEMKEAKAIEPEKKEEKEAKAVEPQKKEAKVIEPEKKEEKPTTPEKKEAKAIEPEKKEEKPTAPEEKEAKAVEPEMKETAKPIEPEKKEAKPVEPEKKEEKPTASGKNEAKPVEPEKKEAAKPIEPEKKEAKAIEPEKKEEKEAKAVEPQKTEAKVIEPEKKEEKPTMPEKKEAKAVEPEMKEAAKPIEPEKKEAKPVEAEKKEEKPTARGKNEGKPVEPEKKEAEAIETEKKEAKVIEPEKKEAAKSIEPEKKEAKAIDPEKKEEKPTAPEKKEPKAVEPEKKEAAKTKEPEKKEARAIEPEKKEEKPTAPEKKEEGKVSEPGKKEPKTNEPEKEVTKPKESEKKSSKKGLEKKKKDESKPKESEKITNDEAAKQVQDESNAQSKAKRKPSTNEQPKMEISMVKTDTEARAEDSQKLTRKASKEYAGIPSKLDRQNKFKEKKEAVDVKPSSIPKVEDETENRGRTSEITDTSVKQKLRMEQEQDAVAKHHAKTDVVREKKQKPYFCTRLTDRTAAQGSHIKLMCSALGIPDPGIQWLKNGTQLIIRPGDPATNRFHTSFQDGLASLEVDNASPGDSGEYTCLAKNIHGEVSSSCTLKVYAGFEPAPFPPTFTRAIKETYKYSDDELTLQCRVRSQPPSKIIWLKNGAPLRPGSRYQQSELADGMCKLVISGPEVDDSGEYTCKAENNIATDSCSYSVKFPGRQHYADLRKTDRRSGSRPVKDFRKPYFSSELTDHLVASGGTIALQVEVKGTPRPEVKWIRGDQELPRASSRIRSFEDSGIYTLLVANASEKEAGVYRCEAYNAFGSADTAAAVEVIPAGSVRGGKPAKIINKPQDLMKATVEDDIIITCRVTGEPRPRVTWMKGTKDITITQRTMVDHSDDYFRFTLKKTVPADAGTYWIIAKNAYGTDRAFVTVQIKNRARSLTPGGFSSSKWEWGSSEILSEIHNRERYARKETPGPITSEPFVADSGRNWLTLSWSKPSNRGAGPVVAYRVDAWEIGGDGGARWAELGVTPVNTFDAFNLKTGIEYKFRITPRNRYGWGEPLVTSSPICVGYKAINMPEFTKILPGQLKALLGSNIRLECQVASDVSPEITWRRDGFPVDFRCDRYSSTFDGKNCQLWIEDLKEEDSGRYMCEAVNKVGRVSTFARLLVVSDPKIWAADTNLKRGMFEEEGITLDSPPQFTMRLRDRRVQMTYPVRLTCQVVGFPAPQVSWFRDGTQLVQDVRHTFWNEDHFHTLEICKAILDDSGCYTATARNEHGSVSCRCNLVVDKGIRAYVAPEFVSELEVARSVKLGGELRLTAQVEAYPSVGVVWHRNSIRLRPSRRIIMTLDHDGAVELALAGVTERDAGVYTCTATNEVGRCETTCRVSILPGTGSGSSGVPLIQHPQTPYSKAPLFITKPRSSEAVEGDTVIIDCEVIGDPKPEVFWLRDFLKPDYYRDSPHFRREGDGPNYRLEIPHAKLDYTGTYSVVARNVHGEAKAVISLQIYAKGQGKEDRMDHSPVTHGNVETLPTFKKGLKDIRCCDGDAVTLECVVSAAVPPEIRWEKGGRLLPLGGDFSAEFDGETAQLTIHQVYPEDEGEYTCVAYNELGRAFTSACLVVDVPEEKENLLSRQLTRPPGLMSGCSTPRSTPRTTPSRSISPYPPPRYAYRESSCLRQKRLKVTSPKFYAVPHNRIAEEGETVRFQCAVAGHPTPWVTWDKDGVTVTPTTRITVSEKDDLKVVEISEVTVEDAGLYRVTLENEVGRVEATARLEVIGPHGYKTKIGNVRAWSASPRASPTFRRRLVGSIGKAGGNVTLACDIRSSPNPVTSWYRDGELVVRTSRISPTWDGHTAMLEIGTLEEEDAGIYTCVAENELGRSQCSAELVVLPADDETNTDKMPPVFIEGLVDLVAEEGNPAELQVQIEGSGPLDVVWVKDNAEIPDCDDFRYVDYGDGRFGLRLADAFPQDSGEYICEVFNQHGDAVTAARLWVKENVVSVASKIAFSKKPTSAVVACGRSVSFCARLQHQDGERHPVVYWNVGGQVVTKSSSTKYSIEEDGDVSILHIALVERRDAGQITCTARYACSACDNDVASTGVCDCHSSTVTCAAELAVLPANSRDNWASDSECDNFTCRKVRSRSLSASEIVADLPKMLRNCTVYSVAKDGENGGGTRALLIRGPADTNVLRGDRVVLSATYCGQPEPQVRWLKGGQEMKNGDRINIITGDGMSSLTVDAITADDSGKYVVSVENLHGADCHFASVAVEGPPDPPAGQPTVTPSGADTAVVEWSSPAFDGGCKITGYVVEMKTSSNETWRTISDSSHSFSLNVKDLHQEDRYKFRVRAENVHGASEPSCESNELVLTSTDTQFAPQFEPRVVSIQPGEVFKAKYEVHEELGKGRYGVVHKVNDVDTNQKLAAKFIRCIKVKDREKVKEEIEIMNCLRHPKLLQLAAAFESPREIVMVMEYISGGELFERVVADDFQLTERDCILFMRQICEGVEYMHRNHVVHLDLKPENIMCQTRTSHEIKLIDFGLAQKLDPNTPVRVLFGTPEFVPPEIINYEPIGVESDMWSVGVICYVLLSGLSPFMGENDAETFANITRASFDFDDEAFDAISRDAKDFISSLLVKRKEKRLTASECLSNKWMMSEHDTTMGVILSTDKLKKFIIRRKWQKTGNAIRALGRMATLSAASRRNSGTSSGSGSPRPSVSRMSSVSQEETEGSMDACGNNSSPLTPRLNINKSVDCKSHENYLNSFRSVMTDKGRTFGKIEENNEEELVAFCDVSVCDDKNRTRVCSERSDSGISDCSSIASSASHGHLCQCTLSATPLLNKKYSITEDVELNFYSDLNKTDVNANPLVSKFENTCENVNISTKSNNETMGTKVDDIRKKFARLSRNIDEMDKKLETVGRELVDIGPGQFTNAKKLEIKRVPSLKDSKTDTKKSNLMQPTASSQAKTVSASPRLGLTIPTSPDLKSSRQSRSRCTPCPTQSSINGGSKNNTPSVSSGVKVKKTDSLKSQSSVDSGVSVDSPRTSTTKRAEFVRLQQMYNSKTTSPTTKTKQPVTNSSSKVASNTSCSRKSKEIVNPLTENTKSPSTGISPSFQKNMAFWKR